MRRSATGRLRLAAVLTVASLGLLACGSDSATTETADPATTPSSSSEEPAAESDIRVGLAYDVGGRGDRSFNDAAAAGLDQGVAEFGITGNESTPTGDGDRAERLQGLIDQGNDLIIGVGFLWGDAIRAGAEANPDQPFAIIDEAGIDLPNVAGLVFAEEEGSFLVGAAAALKSQTGIVGFIGGVQIDLIQRFEAGFAAGARAVNPDIEVLSSYITQPPDFNGFNDPARGKEIAAGMYEAGADVVYSAAGSSGLGAFEAAREAGEPGEVWAIGVDSDQYLLVSEDLQPYLLTSMLKKVDVATFAVIESIVNGTFEGGVQVFDLAADGVGYSTSGGFIDDIVDQLEELKAQVVSGEITVPQTP